MTRHKKLGLLIILLAVFALFALGGCSLPSPTGLAAEKNKSTALSNGQLEQGHSRQPADGDEDDGVVESEAAEEDDDDLEFLMVAWRDPAEEGVSRRVIGPEGGVLPHAAHRLEVPAGALNEPLELTFAVPLSDTLMFDMGPHGTQFNLPVSLVFSYRNADLTGVNPTLLQVYYYNPEGPRFEAIPTQVDTLNKVVIGYTDHFSRYALIRK